jgi:gamma-glutamyltranspeptidase/glutathione hydrolase
MGHNRPDAIHVMTEALKLGLADRDLYYGDPLFADVPAAELLSRKYADLRRPLIEMSRASLEHRAGDPRGGKALLAEAKFPIGPGGAANDTTTCAVADAHGNVVACTPSGFAGVVAGKTGVWLGTRLQSFNTHAGSPNCIEPGKRPRITLTPGLVLRGGKAVLVVSAAGGDAQDQTILQLIVNHIDFGLSPEQSVTAPRFGTDHLVSSFRQKGPQLGSLLLNPEIGQQTIDDLKGRGHKVALRKGPLAAPVAIAIDPQTGELRAAGDPKARRHAAAY